MFATANSELAPSEDRGLIISVVNTPAYATLDYLERTTGDLHDVLDKVEAKEHIFAINGSNGPHEAFAGLLLKPWNERQHSAGHILRGLQGDLLAIPGGKVLAFPAPPLPGAGSGTPLQMVVTTTGSYEDLTRVMDGLEKRARDSGLFIFVDVDLAFDTPKFNIAIDRDAASRLGIGQDQIAGTLAVMLGGNKIGEVDLKDQSGVIVAQAPRDFRDRPDWLARYEVRTRSGALVPLSTVVKISEAVQPNALKRFNQLNAATLSAVPMPGHSLGEAIAFVKRVGLEDLPPGYSYDFAGESRQYVEEGYTLVVTFVMALVVIFLVLAVQYESLRDPLVILIVLPTSIFGAMIPVTLGMASLNIYTQIGLVTLIGLIAKHGILMIDHANAVQRQRGLDQKGAILEAAKVRLRPVLMTTAAMVVAMMPMIYATGAGAASRSEMGLVIAMGLGIGTLFTLFVTPTVYTLLAPRHVREEDAATLPVAVGAS